jgi:magnesium-transporting ATPase (P-type)
MLRKMNQSIEDLRKDHLKDNYIRFQFSSKRKRMSTIIENCGETEHGYDRRIHMKGASEQVIKSCQYYLDENEQKKTLDDTSNTKLPKL